MGLNLVSTAFLLLTLLLNGLSVLGQDQMLPPWQKGMMDIHHINTGRGNATYMIFPDGTTLLFDAGEISDTHARTRSDRNSPLRPNSNRPAHEWIAEYIRMFSPANYGPILDYALISHFHDDHFGEWDSLKLPSGNGPYIKTGITGVAEYIPVKRIIDRGHKFPVDLRSGDFKNHYGSDEYHIVQTLDNYFTFLETGIRKGMQYDSLVVGASDQITLVHDASTYPGWQLLNVAGGGKLATGFADRESVTIFPEGIYPGENPLSLCIKISYGNFDYFTGGDISGIDDIGSPDFQSMEAQVAPVVGAVDVATLNHHGNRDSQSPFYIRTIRPRVWIQQTWSSDHPGHDVLRRMLSSRLYPGARDIFTTDLLAANINVMGETIVNNAYAAKNGHIVVRINKGGDQYRIYVLNDRSEQPYILSAHGPYRSR